MAPAASGREGLAPAVLVREVPVGQEDLARERRRAGRKRKALMPPRRAVPRPSVHKENGHGDPMLKRRARIDHVAPKGVSAGPNAHLTNAALVIAVLAALAIEDQAVREDQGAAAPVDAGLAVPEAADLRSIRWSA